MKIFALLIFCTTLFVCPAFSYDRQAHEEYLAGLRSSSEMEESVRIDRRGYLRSSDGTANPNGFPSLINAPRGTIGFRLSEDFINKILDLYLGNHEIIKDLRVLFLLDKVAVDGKYRFVNELLDIDLIVPFTVESKTQLSTDDGKTIQVDIHKITLWEDCQLPSDKLLEAVIKYINATRLGTDFVKIGFQKINFNGASKDASPYDSYGRVTLLPKIEGVLPAMPKLTLLNIGVRNHEMKVVGQ